MDQISVVRIVEVWIGTTLGVISGLGLYEVLDLGKF